MAPAKGAKRAAPASAGSQKKPKVVKSEHERMLDIVAKEVGRAGGLPPACRLMLEGALPDSLGVPKEERLACQSRVVEMVAEALAGLRDEKDRNHSGARLKVEALCQQEAHMAQERAAAEGALAAKRGELEARAAQAAEADALLAGKRAALDASAEAQRLSDADRDAAAEECAAAEGVVETGLRKLVGGHCESASEAKVHLDEVESMAGKVKLQDSHCESASEAKVHLDEVESMAGKVKLQDSLMVSLRSALGKNVEERGGFDAVVVQEAEKSFRDEVARRQGVIADLRRTSAERASTVEAARAEVAAAEDAAKERAAAMEEARAGEAECEAAREKAEKQRADFMPVLDQARRALDRAEAEAKTFLEGPLAVFEKLSDRVADTPREVGSEPGKAGEEFTDLQRIGTECTSAGA